jgi:hypothetical protein
MSEELTISRRRALSLLGVAAAFGLAVPPALLTVSDAEAQTSPPANPPANPPAPSTEGVKPVPEETRRTRRKKRRYERRKYRYERREYRQKHRIERGERQQPSSTEKPK